MRKSLSLAAAISLIAVTAQAQNAPAAEAPHEHPKAAACATPGPAPAEFAGFDTPTTIGAGLSLEKAPALELGRGYALSLTPALGVTYAKVPGRPPEDGRFAGLATFSVTKEGTYAVATNAGVWIDVLSGTIALDSTSHRRVDYSSVRKVVNFALKPGAYVLQLSAAPAASVVAMIKAAP